MKLVFFERGQGAPALAHCRIKPIPALVHGLMQLDSQRQQCFQSLLQAEALPVVFAALKARLIFLAQPNCITMIYLAVLKVPRSHPECAETAL